MRKAHVVEQASVVLAEIQRLVVAGQRAGIVVVSERGICLVEGRLRSVGIGN